MRGDSKLLNCQITQLLNRNAETALKTARDSKAIVGILEFRRDARSGGAAGHFDLVAPGSAAGGLAHGLHRTLLRAARVALRRKGVIIRVVPVAAPFVNVVANIVQAECVGSVAGDWFR